MQCFNWKKNLFTEETQNMQDKKNKCIQGIEC